MNWTDKERAAIWKKTAGESLMTSKLLSDGSDFRSCVSRAYYAVFQLLTSICILHGDIPQFPSGWNNPSHEQLPDLMQNNGDISISTRRAVKKILVQLRELRVDADYRMGRPIDRSMAKAAVIMADSVFERMET